MNLPDRDNFYKQPREENDNAYGCQIDKLPAMSEHIGADDRVWQKRNRLKRILKRRISYVRNYLSEINKEKNVHIHHNTLNNHILKANDIVKVRSKEEIQATLNRWNQLKGCALMQEMWQYCNTEQKVFKRVSAFLDERDYLMKNVMALLFWKMFFVKGQ